MNSFLDPTPGCTSTMTVSINKVYLVSKRIVSCLLGALRNGEALGTGKSYCCTPCFKNVLDLLSPALLYTTQLYILDEGNP